MNKLNRTLDTAKQAQTSRMDSLRKDIISNNIIIIIAEDLRLP